MTTYSLPDLTGKNPQFLHVNLPFYIYENNIKLVFENSPVFASSIRIALTDGSGTLLVKDTHWRVESTDVDQTAMSKAFLEDNNFKEVLVKSITMISPLMVGKQVAINVQQFYDTAPGRFFDDGQPIEVTPALIKSMIAGLADLRQQVSRVSSPVTPNDHAPLLLPFDINKEFAGNKIVNEKITVNTVGGGKVLRLTQGAFFADSVVIKRAGVALQAKTDYLPVMVSPLTKQTVSKGGIYQYILLLKEVTGDVTVDYHAVGGEIQPDDVSSIYELSLSLKTFLDDQIFITPETVTETAAFRAVNARLNIVETKMRSLLSGNPSYGDATANTAVRRPIQSTDAKFHWWTIANLYKVQGSSDVVTADQFKGRAFFPGAKVALSFTVDVNLNQARNPVTFATSNLVFDPLYTLFADVSAAAPVYPMLRVVWNKVAESLAGASLQIGLPLTSLTDQMVIEDLSTHESCWLLDKTGQLITGGETVTPSAPRDSGFTLPDGASVWASTSPSSESRVHVPAFSNGYLVYSGSAVTLTQLFTNESTKNLFNVVLPTYFPVPNLSTLLVTVASSDGSKVYDIEINLPATKTLTKYGKRVFSDSFGRQMVMTATVIQDNAGVTTVSLNTSDASGNPSDVVRYIRAKV